MQNNVGDAKLVVDPAQLVDIELPFSGFYESWHDEAIDRAIEDGFNYDFETGEEKEITEEVYDAIYDVVDWQKIRREYCQNYVEAFGEEFGLTLTFDKVTSPREYNFATDRIFCKVPREQIDKIRKEVEADDGYAEHIRESFTSRSGFWSNYDSDVKHEDWTREILDECQYRTVLQYYIDMLHRDDPHNNTDWNEREYYMLGDQEMCNWDSVIEAQEAVDKRLKETA